MEKLIGFYKELCNNYGIKVNESGQLMLSEVLPYVIDNKVLVLPTKDNVDNVVEKDPNGKLVIKRSLFNPLAENPIKGDSVSFKEVKKWASINIASSIEGTGRLLLMLAKSKEAQKKTTMMTNQFLAKLNEANTANIKDIVDDGSIDAWDKIWGKLNDGAFVTSKKLGVVNGKKFTRLASLSLPVYDELCGETPKSVLGVTLRRKDSITFKNIIEFLLPEIVENKVVYTGTNDTESPSLISILLLTDTCLTVVNSIVNDLKHLHLETYDNSITKWTLTRDDILLSGINYRQQVSIVPNELDFAKEKSKEINHTASAIENKLSTVINNNIGIGDGYKQYLRQDQIPQPVDMNNNHMAPVEKVDPMLAVLNGIDSEKRMKFMTSYSPAPVVSGYGGGYGAPVGYGQISAPQYAQQQMPQQYDQWGRPIIIQPQVVDYGRPATDQFGRPLIQQQQYYQQPIVEASRIVTI